MNKKYTTEHIDYLKTHIKGRNYQEFTDMFNQKFGLEIKVAAMISFARRHGLRNEVDTRFDGGHEPTQFKKGMTPWNKGKKGVNSGHGPTRFKEGQMPWNYMPVGTERINTDGYVDVKIADPKTWKQKHIIIWEEANGPIPEGHCLIFADGNQLNVTLDNLLLISRRELAVMNKHRLISNDAELTKTGVVIVDIHLKIGERRKGRKC